MVDELRGEFPNQIIRASAGTGKTFRLSNRYLRLLASGAECQSILATTFTKKGAGEILDRIMNRLS
ncbi:MAG: UvrD-helicase domain-containing protein, partial [Planctomycetota bacterium]